MSSLIVPIHVEAVGLGNLRFFSPPSGGQEFPWVSVDDLHACLALPRALRRDLKQKLRLTKWKEDTATVATSDGILSLVPHYMAQGLIGAMRDVGRLPPDFDQQYLNAGGQALSKLTLGLSPQELLVYLAAAWANVGGAPSDGGRA